MQRNKRSPLAPIIVVFLALTFFFTGDNHLLERHGFDRSVLIVGNLVLFAATLVSYFLAKRGLTSSNAQAFVRSVYSSILIKLFVCLIASVIYIILYRKNLNKPALFTCMGLYLVYTFIEVSVLTRLLKEKKNA